MISMIKERLDSPPVATLMRVTAEIIPVQAQESDIQQLVQLASSSVSHPVQASDGSMNPADIDMRGKYVRSENHQVDQTIPLPITPVRPMNLALFDQLSCTPRPALSHIYLVVHRPLNTSLWTQEPPRLILPQALANYAVPTQLQASTPAMNSPCQDVPRMSKPIDNIHVDLSERVKHNHLHAEHIKGVSWTYPDKSVGKERLAYLIFSEDLPQTASIGTHREP